MDTLPEDLRSKLNSLEDFGCKFDFARDSDPIAIAPFFVTVTYQGEVLEMARGHDYTEAAMLAYTGAADSLRERGVIRTA